MHSCKLFVTSRYSLTAKYYLYFWRVTTQKAGVGFAFPLASRVQSSAQTSGNLWPFSNAPDLGNINSLWYRLLEVSVKDQQLLWCCHCFCKAVSVHSVFGRSKSQRFSLNFCTTHTDRILFWKIVYFLEEVLLPPVTDFIKDYLNLHMKTEPTFLSLPLVKWKTTLQKQQQQQTNQQTNKKHYTYTGLDSRNASLYKAQYHQVTFAHVIQAHWC